jgi:hypothetical protein
VDAGPDRYPISAGPTAPPTRTAAPTAVSTATSVPVSTTQRSLELDGGTAYAEGAATPELNLTSSWTIETWFKDQDPAGYRHDYRMLIDKGEEAASEVPFYAIVGDGSLVAGIRTGGTNYFVCTNLAGAGTWQHVAVSFDSASRVMTVYLNGAQVGNQTLAGRAGSGNALAVEIGRQGQGSHGDKRFLGSIDDVRIWNVARSSSDIQANFRRELAAPVAGLVANWQFNSLTNGVTSNLVASAPGAMLGGAAVLSADVHP